MQDHEQISQFLHTVPLFRGLENKQMGRLARRFTERAYAAGETVVTQGAMGIGLFIIETGRADVIRVQPDGDKQVVNKLGPTDFFGELSLLDESPRTASVIAVDDMKCLILTQLDFMSALHEDSDIPIVMLKEMAKRFRRVMDNM
jgi:CRP/FNR family cyclic AMP-dependent transcriptional regulator